MGTLVLLPGMDGTGQLFAPLIAEIASTVRVQVVRYPVNSAESYAQLGELVRRLLPPDDDYVIVGESFSGPIAVSLAAEMPPRLKGLVLCCSFVSNPRPGLGACSPFLRFFPIRLASTSLALKALLGRYATKAVCSSLQAAITSVAPKTLRARMRAIISVNVAAELAKVGAPILYLQATQDRLVPAIASQAIQKIQPSVKIVPVDGPHFLLQASAKDAAVHINKFLAQVLDAS